MNETFGKSAILEFEIFLQEIEGIISFIRASSALRPRLNSLIDWTLLDAPAKELVKEFLDQKTVELSSQYRGMVILISGAFEQLVRKFIDEIISEKNKKYPAYDNLPEGIQIQNFIRTGRVLATFGNPKDHLTINYQLLIGRLATCFSGSKDYALNPEVFSFSVSNLTSKNLEEIFNFSGVKVLWDDFGRNKEFETMLNTKGARSTGKAIAEKLDKFCKIRNQLAHTGTGGLVVTDDDILNYIIFFRSFSNLLVAVLKTKI